MAIKCSGVVTKGGRSCYHSKKTVGEFRDQSVTECSLDRMANSNTYHTCNANREFHGTPDIHILLSYL